MYSAEELEVGKLYKRGDGVVVLRERTGEKEVFHGHSTLCDVYIFDELRDYRVQDFTMFKTDLQVRKNCKVLLNSDYKCFEDFDLEEFKKEKIEPLTKQVDDALSFVTK